MSKIWVGLLGPVELRVAGAAISLSNLTQGLVAVLAQRPSSVVSVERIVDALWGEMPPVSARNRVQALVSSLRRRVGPVLVTQAPGYLLDLDDDQVDLAWFERRTAAGRAAGADRHWAEAAEQYRAALALWRGTALEGCDAPGLRATAARLEEMRLAVTEERVNAEMEMGRHNVVLADLGPVVAAHPLRERPHGQLMLALFRCGRAADALEVYRQLQARLADELGLDPSAELGRLHTAILRADTTVLSQPAAAPSSPRMTPVPAELPPDVGDFTGRAEELKELDQITGRDTNTLIIVAITGPGGVGKTALALHWSHRAASRFPDGQVYLNLRGYDPGQQVRPLDALGSLLRSLGVPGAQLPTDLDRAARMYRSLLAGRRVLILLDNARSAEQIRPLLPGAAGCLVLTTSRDRLGGLIAREGAQCIRLDVLAPAEAVTLLVRMIGEERVALVPDGATALARACGLLPLALRIAAANLIDRPAQRIVDYAAALNGATRLSALTVGDDGPSALPAVFDLSYRALPPDAQRLFRLLGLVPGPDVTLALAAALCGHSPAEALRHLHALTSASMIDETADARYALHTLLHEYARMRAESDAPMEREAATQRMLDWYRDAANFADRRLRPTERGNFATAHTPVEFPDQAAALAWLDSEAANLIAAVEHYADTHPRSAWQIAAALYGWLMRRHHRGQWVHLYTIAGSAASRIGDADGEAMLVGRLAIAHSLLGNTRQAVAACRRCHELRRGQGDRLGAATALLNLAAVHINAGEPEEALRWLTEVERLRSALPDARYLALLVQTNLGEAHLLAGRYDEALHHYRAALMAAETDGSLREAAQILIGLGAVYCHMAADCEALEHYGRGLELAEQQGDMDLRDEAYEGLGRLYAARGERAAAVGFLHKALEGYHERGHRNTDNTHALLAQLHDGPDGG